ncbi:hypothetical protein CRM22_000685 [Opisthorchis felineus]|uniref:Uncharacterized protein n=1 Tax=Opisthorchis felineus TaxID=147828 RepID=A0A4V3SH55_OPIFE|nr:hypothetical protein CRM22_000685 [Opisthorchis felineus]
MSSVPREHPDQQGTEPHSRSKCLPLATANGFQSSRKMSTCPIREVGQCTIQKLRQARTPTRFNDKRNDTYQKTNLTMGVENVIEGGKHLSFEEETISMYRARISRLEAEVNHYRAKLQQTTNEVARLRALITNTTASGAHEVGTETTLTENHVAILKRERDDLLALVSQLRQRSTLLLNHNRELVDQVSSSVKLMGIFKEEKQRLSEHAARLEKGLATLRGQLSKTIEDKTQEYHDQMAQLAVSSASELDQLQLRLLQSETELVSAKTQLGHLESRVQEMERQLVKTKQEAQDVHDESQRKLEEASVSVTKANSQRNDALVELEQLRKRLLDLQTTHSKKLEHVDELYKNAKNREAQLDCELIAIDEERHRLASKAAAAVNEASTIRQELNQLAAKHSLEMKKIESAARVNERRLVNQLNETKTNYERRLRETTSLMEQYRRSMEQLKDMYSAGVQQFGVDTKRLTAQQATVWKFHKKCKRIIQSKARLEQEMARQLLQMQHSQERITELESQLAENNQELHHLKASEAKLLKDRRILAGELRLIQQQWNSDPCPETMVRLLNRWTVNFELEDVFDRVNIKTGYGSIFNVG